MAFHTARGLSGGADYVATLHHITHGLLLDHLTVPLQPESDPLDVAQALAHRLYPADTRGHPHTAAP